MKKFAQIRQIPKNILPIARLLLLVPVGSQKYKKILIFSYFHISTCGQIWLNHFPDDSHLSYITKLEKETLSGTPPPKVNRHPPPSYLHLLNEGLLELMR
jgi:hypothetical protein